LCTGEGKIEGERGEWEGERQTQREKERQWERAREGGE